MRKLQLSRSSVIIFLWVLACSLLLSSTASATSDYDAMQLNGGQPKLISSQCNSNTDLSSWETIVQNQSKWTTSHSSNFSNFMVDYAAAKSNGKGWALLENKVKHPNVTVGDSQSLQPGDTHITLMVTPVNINAQFITNGVYDKHLSPIENTWLVRIAMTNDCTKGPMVVVSSKSQTPSDENQLLAWNNSNSTWLGALVDIFPIFINYTIAYPSGFAGTSATDPAMLDTDEDGLSVLQEASQGTSNEQKDTDGDGLSDYIESQWYPNRNAIFCGTSCAYPNPTQKDLYVEIDWMKNGSRTIKPSASQLADVVSSYASKGITAHFDTGQYGGGNELPVYANELYFEPNANDLDFFDLKNGNATYAANFNANRDYIWHYMISGYKTKYWDTSTNQWVIDSSGAAYPGDDDLFISVGHIEDGQASFNYSNLDTALSGTIMHEIGHTICLSSSTYVGQSAGCQFNLIDTWANSSYDSVMNYTHQMFQVDYSNGSNGTPNDHDDWTAVLGGGLKDFTDENNNSGDSGVQTFSKKEKKKKVVRGITAGEAKTLKKAGKLGGKYKAN